jgi:hypothetical protein
LAAADGFMAELGNPRVQYISMAIFQLRMLAFELRASIFDDWASIFEFPLEISNRRPTIFASNYD